MNGWLKKIKLYIVVYLPNVHITVKESCHDVSFLKGLHFKVTLSKKHPVCKTLPLHPLDYSKYIFFVLKSHCGAL